MSAIRWLAGLCLALACVPLNRVHAQEIQDTVSPFNRRDLPPLAVAGLLTFASQGDFDNYCFVELGDGQADPRDCRLTIPDGITIDVTSFDADPDVEVVVQRPDGSSKRQTLVFKKPADDLFGPSAEWDWLVSPGDPVGVYTITARSQHHRVSKRLIVSAPEAPRSLVYHHTGEAGSTFSIELAGFAPGASIPLELHRNLECTRDYPQGTYQYLTELGEARADDFGNAVFTLQTAVDDPACWYAIETRPASARLGASEFHLTGKQTGAPVPMWESVVDESNRVWASLVARHAAPVDNLRSVYGEPLRTQFEREIEALQSAGEYRVARQVGPTLIRTATEAPEAVTRQLPRTDGFAPLGYTTMQILASEYWEDRLYSADGTVLEEHTRRELWRYVVTLVPRDPGGELAMHWLVVQAEFVHDE